VPDSFFPVRLKARYAETDQMGVVHHSVYPVWFEVARTALSHARANASWHELRHA